jgi:hypothetical protein
LSALVPTRFAVRVIVFNTLLNDRLQAVFRIRLAICYPSNWFDLSSDYRAKPLSSPPATEHLPELVAMSVSAPITGSAQPNLSKPVAESRFRH